MHLKKPKEEVLLDIRYRVMSRINWELNNSSHNIGNMSLNDFKQILANAIISSVNDGFDAFMDNVYTNEEFEKDLTINT